MSDGWSTYEPPSDPAPSTPPAAANSPASRPAAYGGKARIRGYDPTREKWRLRLRVAAMVGRLGLVLGAVGVASWGLIEIATPDPTNPLATLAPIADVPVPADEPPAPPPFEPFSDATTSAMIAALTERTGSNQALEVTFFEEQIIIKVPGPTDDGPAHMYTWDGELELYGETDVYRHPFDISPLRGSAVGSLCGEDLQECVAEVHKPYDSEEGRWMEVTDMTTYQTRYGDLSGKVVH